MSLFKIWQDMTCDTCCFLWMSHVAWSNLEGRPWFGAHCRGEWWRFPAAAWRTVVKDADLLQLLTKILWLSLLSFQQAQVIFRSVFVSFDSFFPQVLTIITAYLRFADESLWKTFGRLLYEVGLAWNPLKSSGWFWNLGVPRFSSFSTAPVLSKQVFSGRQGKELFYLGHRKWYKMIQGSENMPESTNELLQYLIDYEEKEIAGYFCWECCS